MLKAKVMTCSNYHVAAGCPFASSQFTHSACSESGSTCAAGNHAREHSWPGIPKE